jgi:hypothetical protein
MRLKYTMHTFPNLFICGLEKGVCIFYFYHSFLKQSPRDLLDTLRMCVCVLPDNLTRKLSICSPAQCLVLHVFLVLILITFVAHFKSL